MNKLHSDHIIGLACIALAVIIYVISAGFPHMSTGANELTGPSFYPRVLALLLVFCGLMQIIKGFRNPDPEGRLDPGKMGAALRKPGTVNILLVCAAIVFFIYALEELGFFITTYVVLCALMWRFGVPWLRNLFYSAVLVVALYLIFGKLFIIYLPGGVLEPLGL